MRAIGVTSAGSGAQGVGGGLRQHDAQLQRARGGFVVVVGGERDVTLGFGRLGAGGGGGARGS